MQQLSTSKKQPCSFSFFYIGLKDWIREQKQHATKADNVSKTNKRAGPTAIMGGFLIAIAAILVVGLLISKPLVSMMTWIGSSALVSVFQIFSLVLLLVFFVYLPYRGIRKLWLFSGSMCERGQKIVFNANREMVPIHKS